MSELKKPAALQFRHNRGEGFVAGYEKEEMDKYLSEADKVIAELKEAQRWRKFPNEKPEEWDTVIVRIGDGFYYLAVYLSNGQGWDIGDGTYHKPEEVTHWMPLPSAPKEDK